MPWPLLAAAVALWPLWTYLWRGYTSPGADPAAWMVLLGAVGAALGIALASREADEPGVRTRAGAFVAVALVFYAATYLWLPPLARAVLGLIALGLALRILPGVAERGGWGLAALVVLAAPATDTLNFFVGGLLRAASAQVAAGMLAGGGHQVRVEDAALWVNERLFSVDAPCSGVNGLWTGLVVAATIAVWRRLGLGGTLLLLGASVGLCVPANGWRAASLVYLSSLIPDGATPGLFTGDGAHAAIGLIVFGCTVLALMGLGNCIAKGALRIGSRSRSGGRAGSPIPATHWTRYVSGRLSAALASRPGRKGQGPGLPVGGQEPSCPHDEAGSGAPALHPNMPLSYCVAVFAALAVPLVPARPASPPPARAFTGWPEAWGNQRLHRLPETEMDRRWARLSPGPLARFALNDGSELLLRWVDRPTRALHPPEDCYRGAGAKVTSLPPIREPLPKHAAPVLWRRCRVSQDGREWEVRSVIQSEAGAAYSDPAWWWWKVAGPGATDPGPWWAITIQRPL